SRSKRKRSSFMKRMPGEPARESMMSGCSAASMCWRSSCRHATRERRSVKSMRRRYANDGEGRCAARAHSGAVQQTLRWAVAVLCGALLSACGSAPESQQERTTDSRSAAHRADRGEVLGAGDAGEETPLPPEAVQQFEAA